MEAQQQPLFPFDPDSVGKQSWDLMVMSASVVYDIYISIYIDRYIICIYIYIIVGPFGDVC